MQAGFGNLPGHYVLLVDLELYAMEDFKLLLLLLPSYISLFFMIQLARGKQFLNETPKKLLFLFMLGVFIFCLTYIFLFNESYFLFKVLHSTYCGLMLLFHPLIYLYTRSLVSERIKPSTFLLHLTPSILFFLAISACELQLSIEDSISFYSTYFMGINNPTNNRLSEMLAIAFDIAKKVHAAQAVYYFLLVYFDLKKHQKFVQDLFTYGESYNLKWLFSINFFYAALGLSGILATTLPANITHKESVFLLLIMLCFAFFTMIIGLKGSEQAPAYRKIAELDQESMVYNGAIKQSEVVLSKIEYYLKKEKAYLDPELTIWDIVKKLRINRTYISQAINQSCQVNFSQYINSYRIEEACRLLQENTHIKLESIALESGFNSLSTFKRAFKVATGKTPSQFKSEGGMILGVTGLMRNAGDTAE